MDSMNHLADFPVLRVMAPDHIPADTLLWIGLDAAGVPVDSGHAPVDQLPASQTLEIILPATRVSPLQIALPPAAGRHAGPILAQALDDRLLGKLDSTHYVQGPRHGDNVLVWVVERDWLNQTLAIFTDAGRQASAAIPEYAFLPDCADVVCASGNDYCYFRDTQGQYACVDSAVTLAALYPDQPIQSITEPLKAKPAPVNLLTGSFTGKSAFSLNWADYRRTAILTGMLVFLLLIQQVVQWQSLSRREARLQQEIRQTFAAAFPGTPIIDPVLQWQSKQNTDSAPGANKDALNLASRIAETMQATIHPRSLDVRDGVLRMVIPETESANARSTLEKTGIPFEFSPVEAGMVRLEIRPKR